MLRPVVPTFLAVACACSAASSTSDHNHLESASEQVHLTAAIYPDTGQSGRFLIDAQIVNAGDSPARVVFSNWCALHVEARHATQSESDPPVWSEQRIPRRDPQDPVVRACNWPWPTLRIAPGGSHPFYHRLYASEVLGDSLRAGVYRLNILLDTADGTLRASGGSVFLRK
jgi:hypothetical protein